MDKPQRVTIEDLARIYPEPTPGARGKVKDHIDPYGRAFISLSPFCVIGAAGPDGSIDVSPRGGAPGFAHVGDEGGDLFLPDRSGNNRLDTIRNLISGSGDIGMMFMVLGSDDVYRVNGRVSATADPTMLDAFVEFGKPPLVVLHVTVAEAFIHCPKAIMRAGLWKPETWPSREMLPSVAQIIVENTKGTPHATTVDAIVDRYRDQL